MYFIRFKWYFTLKFKLYTMKVIGEKIRKIRELRGYSQEYVASKLRMSQNNYSRIELEQTKVTLDRLEEIASALEVETMDILNFDDRYVFHSASHNQTGDETKSGIFNYERMINALKEELSYLREENRRLLGLLERAK